MFAYDNLGRRTGLTRGNGSTTAYAYDALSRLQSLSHDLAGTAHDVTIALTYNPASQIATRTLSNDLYAWTGHGSGSRIEPAAAPTAARPQGKKQILPMPPC